MKVGSLVEMIKESESKNPNVIYPQMGVIYTVREIVKWKTLTGIRLEEIVNGPVLYSQGLLEPAWLIEYFREVQPPMDLSFINELQTAKTETA